MKKLSTVLIGLLCLVSKMEAATVYASAYGYNTTNATAALQAAINSGNTTIIVDVQAADWNVGPIVIDTKNPLTIIFNPGVIVRALPGQFPNNSDCLFEIKNSQNIILKGYGASLFMNKTEYTTGEKRHAISIQNSKKVTVCGFQINNSGGDGIFVGADYSGTIKYSENVTIIDCVCDGSKRNGITIADAKTIAVSHSEFRNASGGTISAGANIEPANATDSIVNIIFTRCRFINNQNSGMQAKLDNLNNTSKDVSVTFIRSYSSGNGDSEIRVFGSPINGVGGFVNFNLCLMDNSQSTGAYFRKNTSDFSVGLIECVFRDIAQSSSNSVQPIISEVTSYSNSVGRHGGINFNNVLITYNGNKPWFKAYNNAATSPGLGGITGAVTVWNPMQNSIPDFGSNANNVTVDDSLLASWPAITLTTYSNDNITAESTTNRANFKIERTHNGNFTFPMCATYTLTGTATNGLDYSRIVGFQIMPALNPYFKDSTYGLIDGIVEPAETITYTINPSWMYSIGALPSSTLTIKANTKRESDFESIDEEANNMVFYNMQSQQLMIMAGEEKIKALEVYSTTGSLILKSNCNEAIDFSDYKTGLYVAVFYNENGESIQRKKFVKN
jgi:hypothetical protein